MKLVTLNNLDTSLLSEFEEMKILNPDSWDMGQYLNYKYDLNAALAFSKLFFPDFIVQKGCILLGFTYSEVNFKHWYDKSQGNISATEEKCNAYELGDYFVSNQVDVSEEVHLRLIAALGAILKMAWELNCAVKFPDRKVVVEVFEDFGTSRITLYSTL